MRSYKQKHAFKYHLGMSGTLPVLTQAGWPCRPKVARFVGDSLSHTMMAIPTNNCATSQSNFSELPGEAAGY